MTERQKQKLLHGTLETLVLKTLSHGARHGYAIARWLEQQTDDVIAIEEGSLYPALYRMQRKGLLRAEWGRTELDRKAKIYHLTDQGWAALEAEAAEWDRFSSAVASIMRSTG